MSGEVLAFFLNNEFHFKTHHSLILLEIITNFQDEMDTLFQ